MKEEKDFDAQLRKSLSGEQFDFNEANWEKAEEAIIAGEKKRKRRFIFWIFFSGIAVGSLLTLLLNTGREKAVSGDLHTEKPVLVKEGGNNNANPSLNSKPEEKNNGSAVSERKELDKKEADIKANENDNPYKTREKGTITYDKKEKNEKAVYPGKQEKNEVNEHNKIGSVYSPEGKSGALSGKQPGKQATTDKQSGEQHKITYEDKSETNTKEKERFIALDLRENSFPTDTAETAFKAQLKLNPQDSGKKPAFVKNYFWLQAGANYSLGWKNIATEANGFTFTGGFGFAHAFNKKWTMLAGLNYMSLSYLNFSNYMFANTTYGFGYAKMHTTITPQTLYYLGLPLSTQFNMNENNAFIAGVTPYYLLTSYGFAKSVTSGSDVISPALTNKKVWGYRDGFREYDVQLEIGYKRRLFSHVWLEGLIYSGLADIKNNPYFMVNKTEHNNGFKLVLTYNFIHK